MSIRCVLCISFFFFTSPPTTEIYTLSLHDALPISRQRQFTADASHELRTPLSIVDLEATRALARSSWLASAESGVRRDRKSTRLNSSHANISYAVFCLKKKNRK